MDRSAINRALAKALAYKACGKDAKARDWGVELMRQLEMLEIIDPSYRSIRPEN